MSEHDALPKKQLNDSVTRRLGWRLAEWIALTGTSRSTVWRQIKRGDLRIVRVGGIAIVPRSEALRLRLIDTSDGS